MAAVSPCCGGDSFPGLAARVSLLFPNHQAQGRQGDGFRHGVMCPGGHVMETGAGSSAETPLGSAGQ